MWGEISYAVTNVSHIVAIFSISQKNSQTVSNFSHCGKFLISYQTAHLVAQ